MNILVFTRAERTFSAVNFNGSQFKCIKKRRDHKSMNAGKHEPAITVSKSISHAINIQYRICTIIPPAITKRDNRGNALQLHICKCIRDYRRIASDPIGNQCIATGATHTELEAVRVRTKVYGNPKHVHKAKIPSRYKRTSHHIASQSALCSLVRPPRQNYTCGFSF